MLLAYDMWEQFPHLLAGLTVMYGIYKQDRFWKKILSWKLKYKAVDLSYLLRYFDALIGMLFYTDQMSLIWFQVWIAPFRICEQVTKRETQHQR